MVKYTVKVSVSIALHLVAIKTTNSEDVLDPPQRRTDCWFSTSKLRSAVFNICNIFSVANVNIPQFICTNVCSAYLLIRLWYQAGDAAVFVQEVLKLQVADDEPLRLSQGFLSRILAVNDQTLENLDTHTHTLSVNAGGHAWTSTLPVHASPSSGLGPAWWCCFACPRPRWTCWPPCWFWTPPCTAGTSGGSCEGSQCGSSCPELCRSAGWCLHRNCHRRSPRCPDSHLMEKIKSCLYQITFVPLLTWKRVV